MSLVWKSVSKKAVATNMNNVNILGQNATCFNFEEVNINMTDFQHD